MDKKRVFFGFEVSSPWPHDFPQGKLLDENHRHMTWAFLGEVDCDPLFNSLQSFPLPPFKVGLAGIFDKLLLLPPRHPHVAAWRIQWLDDPLPLEAYQKAFIAWLQNEGFNPREREEFLPHVTICRSPFNIVEWKKSFVPLPVILKHLHLYESKGGSHYTPLWSHELRLPFQEIEHTADVAYIVRGEDIEQLKTHAFIALAFKDPAFFVYAKRGGKVERVEDIVIALNEAIAHIDQKTGCGFKAVSFHGNIVQEEDETLCWEMIVDV